ncbi:MAG: response regulator [Pararhizobium sp.]
MAGDPRPFSGLRILVVEDAYLTAEELAGELGDWGCEVIGPEGYVDAALALVERTEIDGALLDVNLHDEPCFDIASALASRHVPFIFLTGYDQDSAFPPEFRKSPRMAKPANLRELRRMIERHFVHQTPR